MTEKDIRASFVNCSKNGAKSGAIRMALPRDLNEHPWKEGDFPDRLHA
ncbi:hypothetical protein GCM10023079_17720 [Streptomyces chitinivorans]